MKNKNLDKGIKEIQNIKMTSVEKSQILENVLNFSTKEEINIKSPYEWHYLSYFFGNTKLAYTIAVCLVLVLSSGGLVFASEVSLPDSVLYPIKIKIIEPVTEALKFGASEKAKYESKLSLKRISEAEALANKNELNDSNKKKLGDLLLNHMDALNKAIDKTSDSREANKIIDNFTEEINARAKILDNNKEVNKNLKAEKKDEIKAVDTNNKVNDNQQVVQETNPEDLKISNVIKLNTERIKENQKKKDLENLGKEIKKEEVHNDTLDTKVQDSPRESSRGFNHGNRDKNDNQRENND